MENTISVRDFTSSVEFRVADCVYLSLVVCGGGSSASRCYFTYRGISQRRVSISLSRFCL